MKKKILALCLVVVLAVTAVTGVTLAYFTDTEQRHNTMVIGNVDIDIDELAYYDSDGDGVKEWHDFEDDKFVLYPQTKEDGMLNYNKMVYTFNNSANGQAAYIRSFILVEVPRNDKNEKVDKIAFAFSDKVERTILIEDVLIDGVYYDAYGYTAKDKKPIESGKNLQSLSSVRLTEDTTNEEAALYGGRCDIIAFSQAIQSEGLTHEEAMNILNTDDGTLTATELATMVTNANGAHINNHWNYSNKTEDAGSGDTTN